MKTDLYIAEIPSQATLDAAMARGRKLRSYAFRDMTVSLFRAIAGLFHMRPKAAVSGHGRGRAVLQH